MTKDEHWERGYRDASEGKPPTLPTSANPSLLEKLAFGLFTGGVGFIAQALAPFDSETKDDISYSHGYAEGRLHRENLAWYERKSR